MASDRCEVEFPRPEIEPSKPARVTLAKAQQRFRMFLAFHHKAVVINVQPALFAEGAQMEAAVQGAVVVEIKVHEGRA